MYTNVQRCGELPLDTLTLLLMNQYVKNGAYSSQCEGREFDPPRLHQFPLNQQVKSVSFEGERRIFCAMVRNDKNEVLIRFEDNRFGVPISFLNSKPSLWHQEQPRDN